MITPLKFYPAKCLSNPLMQGTNYNGWGGGLSDRSISCICMVCCHRLICVASFIPLRMVQVWAVFFLLKIPFCSASPEIIGVKVDHRQTDRQTDKFWDTIYGVCGFFLSAKFATSLLAWLAGRHTWLKKFRTLPFFISVGVELRPHTTGQKIKYSISSGTNPIYAINFHVLQLLAGPNSCGYIDPK